MTVIVADMGATNARFSFIRHGKMADVFQFACADFKNPEEMILAFKRIYAPKATSLVLGVAGPVSDDKVCWTNRNWSICAKSLKKNLLVKKVILKNDVQVQCLGLPLLKKTDYVVLQKGKRQTGPKTLLSVGTGVGAAYYINGESFSTEYGQTLMLTGEVLEKRICALPSKGKKAQALSYQKFYSNLAEMTTNLALTLKPMAGIYLYGRMLDEKLFSKAKFVAQFNAHSTMKKMLQEVPIFLIKKENLAFLGLKELARKYGLS